MCGITAIFGNYETKEDFVKKSLEKIQHRGTNTYEYRVFKKGALGANRLPIVGRSSGQQPLSNEDETIFAAQNGEIFNYKELKSLLEKKGHKFKTECDTEVLVHLYEEFGEDLIYKLDSEMYAFVIYDSKKNSFFVGRDRFGVKPLYYAYDGQNYFFSSELKQLAQFDFLTQIKNFPKGHFMVNGKLKQYHKIKYNNSITDLNFAKTQLTHLLVEAVKKRVDTDLPVAVLLSGGVDSSIIMEIATRFHKDVTGFILGVPGSSDYEAAIKLCKDNNYKHQIVYPSVNYAQEFENLIYHLELYEAQVIRQSFALDILAKEVVRAGFKIALVGEASDEIFGGYNEFSRLNAEHVNKGCFLITNDLERSHNMRVDRMSMKHTLETRSPFFDTRLVEFAMKLDGSLKVKKENHQITTKYILRKVAEDFLPDYIAWRYKVPFSNGAGMNVGFNFRAQDGDVAKQVLSVKNAKLDTKLKHKYGFVTDEELIYFETYSGFGYNKLVDNEQRIITKETLSKVDDNSQENRILVAEFGRLPLYFPLYYASKAKIYKKHKLDVNFIASGGDDLTYNSLLSGSAQIGVADPVFTFTENFNTKGKIIGQLIGKVPIVAITLNPNVVIKDLSDFEKYNIGTFQEFSTTNTLIKELLPKKTLIPVNYLEISHALKSRKIDIAIMTPDLAYDLVGKGGRIVFEFENKFGEYLFTGLTVCDNLDPRFQPAVRSFLASVKESINLIKKNQDEALSAFKSEFPELLNHEQMLNHLINFWNKKLTISESAVSRAKHTWKKVYPWLLKSSQPQFIAPRPEDKIIQILSNRDNSRDIPYLEDELAKIISTHITQKAPINLVGFWGASDKDKVNEKDIIAINKFKKISSEVKSIHSPGIEFTFILSDEHARLNKYSKESYSNYLRQIKAKLSSAGFNSIYLSQIWQKQRISDSLIYSKLSKLKDSEWKDLSNRKDLEKSAQNRGFKKFKQEAKRYFVCRKIESEALMKEYPDMIFHTYSEDIHQNILPDCPTIYLWVAQRGHSLSPWFDK